MMNGGKKVNLHDCAIQIRIMKALESHKPFGPAKHFRMIDILRGLKQPNVLTPTVIWKYLEDAFDIKELEKKEKESLLRLKCSFDEIFDD